MNTGSKRMSPFLIGNFITKKLILKSNEDEERKVLES